VKVNKTIDTPDLTERKDVQDGRTSVGKRSARRS
jgi:hypothetical protein